MACVTAGGALGDGNRLGPTWRVGYYPTVQRKKPGVHAAPWVTLQGITSTGGEGQFIWCRLYNILEVTELEKWRRAGQLSRVGWKVGEGGHGNERHVGAHVDPRGPQTVCPSRAEKSE